MQGGRTIGENLLTATRSLAEAVLFTFKEMGPLMKRGLPVLGVLILFQLASIYLLPQLTYAHKAVQTVLYSIFAVSWHRFTLLPESRSRPGFPLAFGMREILFALVAAALTFMPSLLLYPVLSTLLPREAAIITVAVISLLVYIALLFVFPAIALDQKIRLELFCRENFKLFFSYIIAGIIGLFATWLLSLGVSFVLSTLAKLTGDMRTLTIIFTLISSFLSILFLGIFVSTISYLFRDVIGIEDEEAAGEPPSPR
ncbi:MAG: hypothetical protein EP348_00160 [Alphaproteobacteria bacterium]|nr:MAG: hypothetical protein EP348_00160 [Alphaproteobacteria bacterium]